MCSLNFWYKISEKDASILIIAQVSRAFCFRDDYDFPSCLTMINVRVRNFDAVDALWTMSSSSSIAASEYDVMKAGLWKRYY